MFDKFANRLGRFLSIFGRFSSPEDIRLAKERAMQRPASKPVPTPDTKPDELAPAKTLPPMPRA